MKIEFVQRGLFAHFTAGGRKRSLTRLDYALGKVPVVIASQQQVAAPVWSTVQNHDACRKYFLFHVGTRFVPATPSVFLARWGNKIDAEEVSGLTTTITATVTTMII